MALSEFRVFDTTQFPAVYCRSEDVYPGYGPQWQAEIESLLSSPKPFYLIFLPGIHQEDASDTRLRAVWLKANKQRLAALCKKIISIETDPAKREGMMRQNAGLEKAFGIARAVVSTVEEAGCVGRAALAAG